MQAIVETTKMSTKGQIIIPKEIRDFTQSKENTMFTVMPLNTETIILKKMDREEMIKEFRKIRQETKDRLSEDEINAIIHKIK